MKIICKTGYRVIWLAVGEMLKLKKDGADLYGRSIKIIPSSPEEGQYALFRVLC